MKVIDNESMEEAVIGILLDNIIMNRINDAMVVINNVVHPNNLDNVFEPIFKYEGYYNALLIMGISKELELTERLSSIFNEVEQSEEGAPILAKKIYKLWMECIRDYFVEVSNRKQKLVKV